MAKRRSYLAAIIGKAWKEVGFVEVLSEAIGGFVFAIIALSEGLEDKHGAFELAAECIGCAFSVPLVAFVLRVLFVAPAELVKEALESKKREEIDPKSNYPAIVVILLVACSFLIIGLCFSVSFNFERSGEKPQTTQASNKETPKPLPEKMIPRPEPPPPGAPTNKAVVSISSDEIETFSSAPNGLGDYSNYMEKVKAGKAAQKAAQDLEAARTKQQAIQHLWDIYLPHYKRMLVTLHDILTSEAARKGDGISQSVDYFDSLPKTIDPKTADFQIAKIGFQKDTNMIFLVRITEMNSDCDRRFKITSDCGTLEMDLSYGSVLVSHIHTAPDFDDAQNVEIDKSDEFMKTAIGALISAQEAYGNKTNSPPAQSH